MKKKEIIKKNYEFSKIINKKNAIKNKYFSIFYQPNQEKNYYGISIPKKTGNAVTRNKIKRQIKSIIDNNKISIPKSYDYVIIVREWVKNIDYSKMQTELINLFNKVEGEKHVKN